MLRQQPLRVAAAIARDSVRLFALTRDGNPEITSISRWQFQTFYPVYPPRFTMTAFTQLARENGGGDPATVRPATVRPATVRPVAVRPVAVRPVAVRPVAAVLRDYQLDGGYTPGPLYALALAAGLAGSLPGLMRRRRVSDPGLAAACLLVTMSAVVLLVSSDAFEFSWRYQLPAVILLPLAGALGFTACLTAVRTATGDKGRRTRPASAATSPQAPAAR